MRLFALIALLLLAVPRAALATWSIIAIDIRTGQVIIASATCVRQMTFSGRQPNGARDLSRVGGQAHDGAEPLQGELDRGDIARAV